MNWRGAGLDAGLMVPFRLGKVRDSERRSLAGRFVIPRFSFRFDGSLNSSATPWCRNVLFFNRLLFLKRPSDTLSFPLGRVGDRFSTVVGSVVWRRRRLENPRPPIRTPRWEPGSSRRPCCLAGVRCTADCRAGAAEHFIAAIYDYCAFPRLPFVHENCTFSERRPKIRGLKICVKLM